MTCEDCLWGCPEECPDAEFDVCEFYCPINEDQTLTDECMETLRNVFREEYYEYLKEFNEG